MTTDREQSGERTATGMTAIMVEESPRVPPDTSVSLTSSLPFLITADGVILAPPSLLPLLVADNAANGGDGRSLCNGVG